MLRVQTRRQFFRLASACGAGAWATTALAHSRCAPRRHHLQIGMIGWGAAARRHAADIAASPDACIRAVCDAKERRRSKSAAELPGPARYRHWEPMLQRERLDAVIIAEPARPEALLAVLDEGLPVYCEAPLAAQRADLRQITEAARRHGAIVQIGLSPGLSAGALQAAAVLRSDAIGRIREVICWSGETESDSLPIPEAALCARGCQALSSAQWALGLPLPASIVAAAATDAGPPPGAMVVRYGFQTDAAEPVPLTWYDGDWAPPYESLDGVRLPLAGALFLAARGQLLVPHGPGSLVLFSDGASRPQMLPTANDRGETSDLRKWLSACRDRRPVVAGLDAAVRLNESVLAGIRACRLQQPLSVS